MSSAIGSRLDRHRKRAMTAPAAMVLNSPSHGFGRPQKKRRKNMKSKPKIALLASIAILAFLALAFGYEIKNRSQFPSSGWTAGFHSYHGTGYDSVPLMVYSVRSEINKGLVGVRIKNRSEKAITSVQLGWYVSDEKGQGKILAKGETPKLAIPNNMTGNQLLELTVPNVSWETILRPVMRKGTLRGDYDIWIVVTKVTYDDGSVWAFSQPTNVARVDGKKNAHVDGGGGGGCANQTCKKDGDVYKCVDGAGELCTNFGAHCDSSICGLND
jgi:hypothetical protein